MCLECHIRCVYASHLFVMRRISFVASKGRTAHVHRYVNTHEHRIRVSCVLLYVVDQANVVVRCHARSAAGCVSLLMFSSYYGYCTVEAQVINVEMPHIRISQA